MTKICDYGCGKEANKQFKNGKWCCSKSQNSCPGKLATYDSWNKGLTKETSSKIKAQAKIMETKIPWNKGKIGVYTPEVLKQMSESSKGRIVSQETRDKLAKINIKHGYYHYHKKAFDLFFNNICDCCGMTNEDHKKLTGKRLSMHCTSLPKDYSKMDKNNWMTVCEKGCHQKLEGAN